MSVRVVVNADDLGLSRASNRGILDSARGVVTSTSIMMNGGAVEHALTHVLPQCPQLGVGVHLNLVEGRSERRLLPRQSALYGSDGELRLRFTDLLARQRDASLRSAIEGELRDQIERALALLPQVDHLDSHQHAHMVPAVFEIVCRLALEYGIPHVRLSRERAYVAGGAGAPVGPWLPLNLVKRTVLNRLAVGNAALARELGVRTTDWLVGITYTGHMNATALLSGIRAAVEASDGSALVEVLVHPCRLGDDRDEQYISTTTRDYVRHPARQREIAMLADESLRDQLAAEGWTLGRFGDIAGSLSPVKEPLAAARRSPGDEAASPAGGLT